MLHKGKEKVEQRSHKQKGLFQVKSLSFEGQYNLLGGLPH